MKKYRNTDDSNAINKAITNITTVPVLGVHGIVVDETIVQTILISPLAADTPDNSQIVIDEISIANLTTITANDTNYWTFQIHNETDSLDLLVAAKTTKSTGGSTMTAKTIYNLGTLQNATLGCGKVIEFQATKSSSATDITNLICSITWHWA